MKLQVKRFVFTSAVWLLAMLPAARGQDVRATLGGRVTDPQGSVVPGVQIEVLSDDTGVVQRTTSNEQGNWLVQYLLPGNYRFTATAAGFKTFERKGIVLQTADRKAVDTQLEIGETSQSIEVIAEVPLIDTTTATSGTVVNEKELTELPSISRVPTLLAVLSPGVVQQDQNNNPIRGWSYNGASQIQVNGGRFNVIYANNFLIDGFPNVKSGGNIAYIPSQDLISEFRVQLSAYDASIERQAGGTFNMTTKSGTKQLHGTFWEYNQNNFLNARQFQLNLTNAVNPPIRLNQWGFTLGGPVWIPKLYNGTRKTFFFLNYEGLRNANPQGGLLSLPTEAERGGDFSRSYTTQTVAGQRTVVPYTIYDPSTVDASGNRAPFPNAMIPANRISPIAMKILQYVALPNQPSNGTSSTANDYVSPAARRDKMAVISARGDQQWTDMHRSFAVVRWSTNAETQGNNFGTPASGTAQVRTPKQAALDHIWTASATKIVDLRFAVNRYEELTQDQGVGFDPTTLGFASSVVSQFRYPQFPNVGGINGPGSFIGAGTNTYNMNTFYTWSGAFTQIHGNHTLRYGASYWVLQVANTNYGGQPQIDFSNVNWTNRNNLVSGVTGQGNSMSQFLLGLPTGGSANFNSAQVWSQRYAGTYFQDDWRVTPRLTLNAGLRWDYERPYTERYNIMTAAYDPTAVNPISGKASTAYAAMAAANQNNAAVQQLLKYMPASAFQVLGVQRFAGVDGQSRQAQKTDWREVQPRFGFAYQLGRNTVVRGGVGRFVMATQEFGGQNGFSIATALNASNDNYLTPAATLSNPYPNGLTVPTGSTLGALTNLGNGVNWINPDARRPYSWQYSLTLQHQIKSWLFEAGYTHNKTGGLWINQNLNLPSLATWQALNTVQFDANGKPQSTLWYNTQVPNPFKGLAGLGTNTSLFKNSTVPVSQLVRPFPAIYPGGNGDQTQNDMPIGKNQYDALLAKVEHRFGSGLTLINSFTWSKLMEDTNFLGLPSQGRLEHRLGQEDRPFRLSVAAVWDLPVGRGKAFGKGMPKVLNVIAGGWELTGQYTLQSGAPVLFNTNTTTGNFFFSGRDFGLPGGERSFARWFDTSQLVAYPNQNQSIANYPSWTGVQSLPGAGYVPRSGDNIKNGVYQDFAAMIRTIPTDWASVRASRVNEMNLGIYKNFQPFERIKIQVRFETYNTLNHPRFAAPNANPADSSFGTVSMNQQNSARTIQMAMRVSF